MSHQDQESVVIVKDLYKTFRLPHEQHAGIKQAVVNLFNSNRGYVIQKVLTDISFEIKKGEFFGIVGRNGSGKSTLLKLLAGIYAPDKGLVQVNGSLTPFIELGVGFNPELTGRENVFMNGALLGFDRTQIEQMYDDIVSFAELNEFMDQKLKNYSSGMQVRLAFSIAIRAKSDILLIDEVLAVGDAAFQQKCYEYFDELKRQKRTIILVSHDMGAIRQFCDKALLVSGGEVVGIGAPAKIAIEYEKLNYNDSSNQTDTVGEDNVAVTVEQNSKEHDTFESQGTLTLRAKWPESLNVKHAGFIIYKNDEMIFATNSFHEPRITKTEVALEIENTFGNGRYKIKVGLFKSKRHLIGIFGPKIISVYNQIDGVHDEEWEGVGYIPNKWLQLSDEKEGRDVQL